MPSSNAYDEIKHLGIIDIKESDHEWVLRDLQLILHQDPSALQEIDDEDQTVLHWAAKGSFPNFCKVLNHFDPELVSDVDKEGKLPLHYACYFYNIETAAFLLGLYPKGSNTPDHNGSYPLHDLLLGFQHSETLSYIPGVELLRQLLLKSDQRVLSTPLANGQLPLHMACVRLDVVSLDVIEAIYNAYPEAIFKQERCGKTPNDIVTLMYIRTHDTTYDEVSFPVSRFLEDQVDLVHKAKKDTALLHDALHNPNVPMGTIKLMIDANPQSIRHVDDKGNTPLHVACEQGLLCAVKYIVQTDKDALKVKDSQGNLPLDLARNHGKSDIINFIQEESK